LTVVGKWFWALSKVFLAGQAVRRTVPACQSWDNRDKKGDWV
jgi:hypothetical protein